jgi:hypothetical protein
MSIVERFRRLNFAYVLGIPQEFAGKISSSELQFRRIFGFSPFGEDKSSSPDDLKIPRMFLIRFNIQKIAGQCCLRIQEYLDAMEGLAEARRNGNDGDLEVSLYRTEELRKQAERARELLDEAFVSAHWLYDAIPIDPLAEPGMLSAAMRGRLTALIGEMWMHEVEECMGEVLYFG